MTAATDRNKANPIAFYDLIFNQGDPRQALERFVGAIYGQHKPHGIDGPQPLIAYFERMAREHPQKRMEVRRAVAEDDLVVLHSRQLWPGDHDYAALDIFRFDADGRIVEHWDVMQTVPDVAANDNTMF